VSVKDDEALEAVHELTRLEGILPALESAHAVAYLKHLLHKPGRQSSGGESLVVLNLSGRGEKDLATILNANMEQGKVH
ncbi:MAG TPA: tryptophan synthase subunit beta, partial [Bacteroidota bacterium]|nr:tryptophan synthase subunit beta [Bacteroidota bacterium]